MTEPWATHFFLLGVPAFFLFASFWLYFRGKNRER